LIQHTIKILDSIKNLTQLSQDKFSDKEFGKLFYRMTTQDIQQANFLLNSLSDYLKATTPIRKKETVNLLIEEELKKSQAQLEKKGVKLFKKLEMDLPEIVVPDHPLRYILNSILQYAVTLIPPNETLGFLTKSFVLQGAGQDQDLVGKGERYVEITVFFTGWKKPSEPMGTGAGIQTSQKEEMMDSVLRMVEEVVHRNRGVMKFQADEKEAKKFISLEFPVERRTVVHYPNNRKC
jgi:hypothetical protein